MKILGIDSSGLMASVALVDENSIIAEYNVNYKKTHSETLMPMIDEIVSMVELDKSDIAAIAVAAGPGSFTGLRIGSATAKGIAEALNIPIVPIPTVDGLAMNMFGYSGLVCPIMDARRNQTYAGIYSFDLSEDTYILNTVLEQSALPITQVIDKLNELGREVAFLGDGVPVFKAVIEELLKVPHIWAPQYMNRQRAAALATLAHSYMNSHMEEDKAVTAGEFAPVYLRLSQAEREQLEKTC